MQKILNKLKNSRKKLLLGFSGGVDSRVLFEFCLRSGVQFGVVHLDHNLRQNSRADSEFVADLCTQNQIQCFLVSAPVRAFAQEWKTGLEDAGRRVRRAIFTQMAENFGYDYVLLAHQADDQLETILLNLKRGTGVHGLAGMREFSGIFWRPMLEIPREKILQFAQKNQLHWREDESNFSLKFLRNRIRHELIPLLEKTDPNFRKNLFKISRNAQKSVTQRLAQVTNFLNKSEFLRQDFLALRAEMRGEILRGLWIKLHGNVVGFERIRAQEIEKLLVRNIGRKKIKFGNFWLELKQGKVYFAKV